jgi:hypothetical protein
LKQFRHKLVKASCEKIGKLMLRLAMLMIAIVSRRAGRATINARS